MWKSASFNTRREMEIICRQVFHSSEQLELFKKRGRSSDGRGMHREYPKLFFDTANSLILMSSANCDSLRRLARL